MNKEVKELIEQLEEYASGGGSGLYPFEESVKTLLDYINQLEKNRDEAINILCDADSCVMKRNPLFKVNSRILKAKEILKRGKE